jgi:hypothetical protein
MATDTLKPRAAKRQGDKRARYLAPPTARERKARGLDQQPSAGRVRGYCRVSTAVQADEGESLDVQRRQIEGYAKMQGLQLDRIYVERGVSGSKPLAERSQGAALLATLKPGDVIITAKLDRMFRSAIDALDILGKLQKQSVSPHMIDLGGDTTGRHFKARVYDLICCCRSGTRPHPRAGVGREARSEEPWAVPRRHGALRLQGRG